MNRRKNIGLGFIILLVGLVASGCGPSPEELAATSVAQTAAAATNTPVPTSTPEPTPTATPIPYDLSLIVVGEEDAPIIGASIKLAEEGDTQISDDVGQVFWYDLPGEVVNISVSAQGYFPQDLSETIDRGVNQITINLERDPHGILPSEACGPGEKLVYLEDFQDDHAQGWPEIEARAQGWDLIPHPDSAGNKVIKYSSSITDTQMFYDDGTYEDAVWRISVMPRGKPETIRFYWHQNEDPGTYTVINYEWGVIIGRSDGSTDINLGEVGRFLKENEWQTFEISTYDDTLEVWLDKILVFRYNDPKPLPGGHIGLELWASENEETMVYFDNLAVCELSAPFVPIPTSEP